MSDPKAAMRPAVLLLLATLAIAAFAGNSLLARAAIGSGAIDAGGYTLVRLASGAAILLPVFLKRGLPRSSDLPGAVSLFIYAAAFSFAYIALPTGTGALVLFACVQATIMVIGMAHGERAGAAGLAGLVLALVGVAWLIAPAASVPQDAFAAALMAVAGVAWGIYTLLGRGAGDPARRTAANFLLATPMAIALVAAIGPHDIAGASVSGIWLAVAAGAITSGLGYVAWYAVAPRLGLATVATVQLATPVAAALIAAVTLAEPLTMRLAVAGAMIIGGIVLTLRK
ncbi:DMT family transporter [Croceicoccus sediminis]|uniref:DMT family transporter n=1 Tax=Croceicoccus sediminis TaxID=2571150 RepID=UPI00196B0C7C|nr:DMT family transporter [Croceicoccus sediminis]